MVCWYSLGGLSCSVAWPMFRRKKPLCKRQSGNRCEPAAKHGPCWHERFSWMPQRKLIHGHLAWKLAYGVIRGESYMYQQAATVEPRNRCSIIESTQSLVKDTTYNIKQDSWPPGRIQGLGVKIWRWNRQLICICQVLQLIYIQSWKPHSIGTCVLHHPVFTLYHKNQPPLCPLLSHNYWVECSMGHCFTTSCGVGPEQMPKTCYPESWTAATKNLISKETQTSTCHPKHEIPKLNLLWTYKHVQPQFHSSNKQ